MKKWLIGILAVSFLPVWRDPGWEGGKNAWEAAYILATSPQKPHIPVEEALEQARKAYKKSPQVV